MYSNYETIILLIEKIRPFLKISSKPIDRYVYNFLSIVLEQLYQKQDLSLMAHNVIQLYYYKPGFNDVCLYVNESAENDQYKIFLEFKNLLYIKCKEIIMGGRDKNYQDIFAETKRKTMIKTVQRLLALIKREDNPDLCFYEFFKYILDVLRRPYELYEVAEKIRVVYAGAGSFNDIYLNSDESEFCFLRDNLYLQCHDAILKSRGAEGIFGQNDFYSGLIYDDKKIKVDFDNHKQNKIEKTDLEKILNGDVEHIKNIDMYEPINSKNKVPVLPINVKRMLLLYLDKRINNEELSSWAKVIYFRSSEYVSVALKDEKNGDSYENMWYVIKKLSTPEIDGKITPEIVKQYLKELHNYFHKKKWFQCKLGQIFGMKKTKPPLPIFDVANSYIDKNRITLTEILKEIGDEVGEKYVWFIIEFDAQGSIDKNITINDINQKIDSEKLGYYEISWDFLKKITSRLSVVVDCSLIGSKSKEEFLRERAKLDQKVRNWTGFLCELDFYIQDGEIWEIKGSDKALVERLTKTFSPLPIYLV